MPVRRQGHVPVGLGCPGPDGMRAPSVVPGIRGNGSAQVGSWAFSTWHGSNRDNVDLLPRLKAGESSSTKLD